MVSNIVVKTDSIGILICETGLGTSITANKFKGIRCAVCHNIETAQMAKKHNNANIIALGSQILSKSFAFKILKIYLEETFQGGIYKKKSIK